MKKQRKLLTDEEKEKICKSRRGVPCAGPDGRNWCPLFLGLGYNIFCYRDIDKLEQAIQNMHNEEIEYNDKI